MVSHTPRPCVRALLTQHFIADTHPRDKALGIAIPKYCPAKRVCMNFW